MARKRKIAQGASAVADAPRHQMSARPHRSGSQRPIASAVSVRRMTQEDERQLDAVIDLFLAELVRQHFDRQQTQ